jgi:enamine deaminase RidA (YjgF/YER057c/UK114 family)
MFSSVSPARSTLQYIVKLRKAASTVFQKQISVLQKQILVRDPETGLANLIQAGPFLFTSGCDGHRDAETGRVVPELAADAERQCEIAYGTIGELLRRANADLSAVVRLDHVTSSQDWLARRQTIRGRVFGRPAPLASTGVAAKMDGINMLTASAIAVADPSQKKVLVEGAKYAMHNISSVVRGGPFLFISGIRATIDPRTGAAVPEETAESFSAQTRMAYDIIGAILRDAGAATDQILRLDCYIRDISRAVEEEAIRAEFLRDRACASTVVAPPLGARGEVEITALALAPEHVKRVPVPKEGTSLPCVVGAEGFLFVGECRGNVAASGAVDPGLAGDREAQLEGALSLLEARLRRAGSGLSRTVRLDLYLRDIYFAHAAREILRRRFKDEPPVVFITGAELGGLVEVKLSAIAL